MEIITTGEIAMAFKIIRGKFPSDVEEQLNRLDEDFHPVDVQAITYDHNTCLYTVVCKVGQEVLPCTTYTRAMLEVEGFPLTNSLKKNNA